MFDAVAVLSVLTEGLRVLRAMIRKPTQFLGWAGKTLGSAQETTHEKERKKAREP